MGWAMVRLGRTARNASDDEKHTLDALRRAGWRVCGVEPGEEIARAWDRLLGTDQRVESLR